jgi:hypothetical protein
MRRHDNEAYGFYRQVGIQLLPYMGTRIWGKPSEQHKMTAEELEAYRAAIKLPPMFNQTRPTFGCIAFGADPKVEGWESERKFHWPRFMYYTKYTRPPPEVQLILGGDIYRMCVWWDSIADHKRKWGTPSEFAVFMDKTGNQIQVLKTCKTQMIPIHAKRKLETFEIPDRHWRIPEDYERWANDVGLDVQTHLCHLFTSVLHDQEYAQYGDARIQVHKGDMTAVFNIDSRRLSYFFQDRDIELTKDGRRKRIFHIVKPQVRRDGVAVKMHYRGEKDFTWAGYTVNITVPGLDHFMQDDINIGVHDEYWGDNDSDGMSETEFGARVVKMMQQGVGGKRRDRHP